MRARLNTPTAIPSDDVGRQLLARPNQRLGLFTVHPPEAGVFHEGAKDELHAPDTRWLYSAASASTKGVAGSLAISVRAWASIC